MFQRTFTPNRWNSYVKPLLRTTAQGAESNFIFDLLTDEDLKEIDFIDSCGP